MIDNVKFKMTENVAYAFFPQDAHYQNILHMIISYIYICLQVTLHMYMT